VGLAERLVYRHPAFALEARLRVVEPQAAAGSPGANVTLEVETWSRHSGGAPVPAPARFGLRVTGHLGRAPGPPTRNGNGGLAPLGVPRRALD
jgi:hypothetical protein